MYEKLKPYAKLIMERRDRSDNSGERQRTGTHGVEKEPGKKTKLRQRRAQHTS